jgi:hypothetical protein
LDESGIIMKKISQFLLATLAASILLNTLFIQPIVTVFPENLIPQNCYFSDSEYLYIVPSAQAISCRSKVRLDTLSFGQPHPAQSFAELYPRSVFVFGKQSGTSAKPEIFTLLFQHCLLQI